MRGKKPYNIRNVEAHLNTFRQPEQQINNYNQEITDNIDRNIMFKTSNKPVFKNIIQPTEQQRQNEYINAKFGVSKYASNLVSGKMFKKI